MKSFLIVFFIIGISASAFGQYWFGPKVGVNYIDHVYQEETYEQDSFDVDTDVNWQAGFAVSYSVSDQYAVHGELLYERIGKTLRDKDPVNDLVYSEMVNHFLSAPIMLRMKFGSRRFQYFVNGGPRLSYWLGGRGKFDLEEFDETEPAGRDENDNVLPVDYRIRFGEKYSAPDNFNTVFVDKPNRLQFGLTLGGGMSFDLATGGRLLVDFRYTWVHSNMGTNSSNDVNLNYDSYRENLEYYHNIATIGIAYQMSYDINLTRKGKSTNKESNKKKK